jgi:hypothetical protein
MDPDFINAAWQDRNLGQKSLQLYRSQVCGTAADAELSSGCLSAMTLTWQRWPASPVHDVCPCSYQQGLF